MRNLIEENEGLTIKMYFRSISPIFNACVSIIWTYKRYLYCKTSSNANSFSQLIFVPVFGGDFVEGDLSVGDGDEALEDCGLEVGEDEAASVLFLAVATWDVVHHGRQGSEPPHVSVLFQGKLSKEEWRRLGECHFVHFCYILSNYYSG